METPETMNQEVTETGEGRMHTRIIIAVVVIVILALGYFFFIGERTPQTPTTAETVGLIDTKTKEPVARVNSDEIERAFYNSMVINLTSVAETQGLDITDATIQDAIKTQALTSLVNNELLLQNASADGITVDDEIVTTEYESLVTQAGGNDVLKERLAEARITPDMLRINVAEQLVVNQYLDAFLATQDLSVSDTEVSSFYDSLVSQTEEGAEVPTLADVRVQLEQQLVLQKQQAAVGSLLETLRANATIEILI
ncbi:SurA N-terminal domain-containing protein [Candidatus Kaiserbacteria bacterium]|nr:SurA N-terminal domain-containing protein [Candidatus Kaiserbacteria bacterium]